MEKQIQPGRSATVAVVEAVSALEDQPPDTLAPLHDVIHNDLDEIFDFEASDTESSDLLRLTFEYEGYYVTIENDGSLSLEPKPENPFAV